jgi:hypothetical protein
LWSPGALLAIWDFSVACADCGHVGAPSFSELGPSALQVGDESFTHGISDLAIDPADAGHLVSHPFVYELISPAFSGQLLNG